MLEPLTQFICDTCSEVIESPDNGWIEWLSHYDETQNKIVSRDFRICHHRTACQKHSNHIHCSDLPLREFVGERAAVQLARFLDVGPYHDPDYSGGPELENMRDFTELMRRLTIPYYEEARQWWREAITDDYFADANEIYIYLPKNLRRMIEHYNE